MWHSRVVYGALAGSYSKVSWKSSGGRRPQSAILGVSHVAKEPWWASVIQHLQLRASIFPLAWIC